MAAAQRAPSLHREVTAGTRPYCAHIIYMSSVINNERGAWLEIQISTVYHPLCRVSQSYVRGGDSGTRHTRSTVSQRATALTAWRRRRLGNGLAVSAHAARTDNFPGYPGAGAKSCSTFKCWICIKATRLTAPGRRKSGTTSWGEDLRNIYKAAQLCLEAATFERSAHMQQRSQFPTSKRVEQGHRHVYIV